MMIRKKRPWIYDNKFVDFRNHFSEKTEPHPYQNAKYTDRFINVRLKRKNFAPPDKILICAPSNAAIDEIVNKILEKGLLDEKGNTVFPFLIRVGPNYNENLQHVSFDHLVSKET
jgi:senataxin